MNRRDWLVAFCGSAMIVLIIAGLFLLVIGLMPALFLHERTWTGGLKQAFEDIVQLLWYSPGSIIWQVGALHVTVGVAGLWWIRRGLDGTRQRDRDQML